MRLYVTILTLTIVLIGCKKDDIIDIPGQPLPEPVLCDYLEEFEVPAGYSLQRFSLNEKATYRCIQMLDDATGFILGTKDGRPQPIPHSNCEWRAGKLWYNPAGFLSSRPLLF